jgi:hypothetical protein
MGQFILEGIRPRFLGDRRVKKWPMVTAAALVAAVGGATGGWLYWSSLASDLGSPPVAWPNGEPSGPLEDNIWGQRYREAERQLSLADANNDFSDPRLLAAVGWDYAEFASRVDNALTRDQATKDYFVNQETLWAQKTIIMSITESDDGTFADVWVCGDWSNFLSSTRDMPYLWRLTATGSGIVAEELRRGDEAPRCGDIDPQPAEWSPRLEFTDSAFAEPKPPAPKWYYEWTGVID